MNDHGGLRARHGEPSRAADHTTPKKVMGRRKAAPTRSRAVSRRRGVRSDPGRYQIRTRWINIFLGLFFTGLGINLILYHQDVAVAGVIFIVIGVLSALPWLIVLACGKVAFRADRAGITLGPEWPLIKFSTEFIAWADISGITFYTITRPALVRRWPGDYLGIVTRPGTQAGGASLRLVAWPQYKKGSTEHRQWLSRQRLAVITRAAAPGVEIVDAGEIDPWVSAGQKFLREVGR